MLRALFDRSSLSHMLRGGLEEASATHRAIAENVATLMEASSSIDFAGQLEAAKQRAASIEQDLQRNMAALADTQLRYEADARLLQQAYQSLRIAIRDRA
ncbi:MAG: hypothetical protein ACOY71_02120 [Gemmatimonadota bacterium]